MGRPPALCAMLAGMGLNPYRKVRRSPADYLMVAGAVVVCVVLVAWALFA